MAGESNVVDDFWGTNLINADKSATPLLEQLCLGIAKIIATLAPITTDLLIPQKLASFYRLVGGNYDSLFLNTPNPGISIIYRSLGCFHSLQPTSSAFETPGIPALLPAGFVRWQTIQILLAPDEHVAYLQEALKRFDIVNPVTGATFPKVLPRQLFAEQPDKAMTRWHEEVSKHLEQEHQNLKFRRSPFQISYSDREDRRAYLGYGSQARRPSRSSRTNSREQVIPAMDDRRRSLPDQNLGFPPSADYRGHLPGSEDMRYVVGNPMGYPPQIRGASSGRHRDSSSSARRQSSSTRSSTRSRPPSASGPRLDPPLFNPVPPPQTRHHHRKRSSTINSPITSQPQARFPHKAADSSSSSGSDASSEPSSPNHVSPKQKVHVFPPTAYNRHHQRSHSHDPSYKTREPVEEIRPSLPSRPINIPTKNGDTPAGVPPTFNHVQGATLRHRDQFRNGTLPPGKFNERIFDVDGRERSNRSSPSSPANGTKPASPRFRHVDPKSKNNGEPYSNNVANNNLNLPINGYSSSGEQRKLGIPSRHSTVSGARGRRYIPTATPVPSPQPVAVGANNAGSNGIPKIFNWD